MFCGDRHHPISSCSAHIQHPLPSILVSLVCWMLSSSVLLADSTHLPFRTLSWVQAHSEGSYLRFTFKPLGVVRVANMIYRDWDYTAAYRGPFLNVFQKPFKSGEAKIIYQTTVSSCRINPLFTWTPVESSIYSWNNLTTMYSCCVWGTF